MLHVVTWYDIKCVYVAFTFSGVGASASVKKWVSGKKQHTDVVLPDTIADYNSSMGGIDLVDMLIAIYRTEIVSKKNPPKKRWYLKIIFQMVDICKVNGWILYCLHCNQQGILKK